MNEFVRDTVVIGAGASGLMAAIACRRAGLNVLVLESKKHAGSKILVSGGGHCNLTNRKVSEKDYAGGDPRAVSRVLAAFTAAQAVKFFEDLGVRTVPGEDGKIFPASQSAQTVLAALLGEVNRLGAELRTECKVRGLTFEDKFFSVTGEKFSLSAKTVVLCTGGLSYPSTGSDGSGYRLAGSFGHSLIPPVPALTPLATQDRDWTRLAGISLPVELSLCLGQKKKAGSSGAMLFTHSGFSGPAVLDISRHWIRESKSRDAVLRANFLPEKKEENFRQEWIRAAQKFPGRTVKTFLSGHFPARFIETLLAKSAVSGSVSLNQLRREDRERLFRSLFRFSLPVSGVLGFEKAEVTAGGIDWKEVNPKTLESRLRPGLFFAGEILDVDGRIGGFNFQWAWASGVAAARGIGRNLRGG